MVIKILNSGAVGALGLLASIVLSGCTPSSTGSLAPGEVKHVVYEQNKNHKKAIVILIKKVDLLEARVAYLEKQHAKKMK